MNFGIEYIKWLEQQGSEEKDLFENPNRYFMVLDLACLTKQSNIMLMALDCLQKLMEKGCITGSSPYEGEEKLIVERLIKMLSNCFDVTFEENLQIQILKTVLTTVTSCHISGKTLMLGIKICLNVHFVSKNEVNSKSILKQVVNTVFKRLEDDTELIPTSSVINEFVDCIIGEVAQEMAAPRPLETERSESVEQIPADLPQNYRDAAYVLNSLSKMAMKDLEKK